jgi:hypothetical protein
MRLAGVAFFVKVKNPGADGQVFDNLLKKMMNNAEPIVCEVMGCWSDGIYKKRSNHTIISSVIPAFAGMTGSHKRFSPKNSSNRVLNFAPQGFDGDCLLFYATLAPYAFIVRLNESNKPI